ncbi:hypothetical protein TNCV_2009301 [Trichonephila clavipes]|nr:hypothetical protein TNCV_2009301 [Trichonephila clavipes]
MRAFCQQVLWPGYPRWSRYRVMKLALFPSSSPVPQKIRRVGQRCTLNPSRAEMSSRWCGVVVRRGGAKAQVPLLVILTIFHHYEVHH